jgi:type I restriction enzyme S subunit
MIAALKPYDDYKETGLPWAPTVPKHWKVRRIKTVLREKDFRNKKNSGELLSLTRNRGLIRYSDRTDKVHSAKSLSAYKVYHPGQIVMNRMQAWSGMFGSGSSEGIVSPDYAVFEIISGDLCGYILERLKTPDLVGQFALASKGIGTGFNRLYTDRFGPIPITIPPPEEQEAIVRFLDHAHGRIDRAIRAKRKVIALLNEQKQAIIHKAVTRGLNPEAPLKPSGIPWLGDIPVHWETPLNSRIFRENIRSHKGKTEEPLSLSQRDGLIKTEHLQERSLKTSTYDNWKVTIPGDLVANRFKAHLGVFFASTLRGIVSFHYAVFEPKISMNIKYFELLYHTAPYRTIYAGRSNGMTVGLQNLSNQNFYSVRSIVPPTDEQNEIVAECEIATRDQNSAIARLNREIELLREYRTRLTADVVTGKLDVREASKSLPAESAETHSDDTLSDPDLEGDEEPDLAEVEG